MIRNIGNAVIYKDTIIATFKNQREAEEYLIDQFIRENEVLEDVYRYSTEVSSVAQPHIRQTLQYMWRDRASVFEDWDILDCVIKVGGED